jgi:hypothetical protein
MNQKQTMLNRIEILEREITKLTRECATLYKHKILTNDFTHDYKYEDKFESLVNLKREVEFLNDIKETV